MIEYLIKKDDKTIVDHYSPIFIIVGKSA